jgi:hypothetical protein
MKQAAWLTAREAQQRTGLSLAAILEAIGKKEIEGTSINGRVLVAAASLDQFLQVLKSGASNERPN